MKHSGAALVSLVIGLWSQIAWAEIGLRTQAPAKIEVGQRFSVQLTAMADSSDEEASQPKLPVPPGFAIQGPSISTQRQVNIVNFHVENKTGITATWILASNAIGRFRIGPASVISKGHQVADKAFIVEIVPPGTLQGQRAGRRTPFDPFDPFGDFDPFSSPMLPPMRQLGQLGQILPGQQEINGWPHELDIAAPRDPLAFLDARIAPKKVVIGQQVTFSVFAYGHQGLFQLGNPSEPSLKDFLTYDLMDADGAREQPMRIGEDVWYAEKIQERALFPLHAGKLVIGPMRVAFRGADPMHSQYNNADRQSQSLTVLVVEPPINGRPAGYHLGDVGQYQLTAAVEPREVTAHEAVSVTFELSGFGTVPQTLNLPETKGIEWLQPSTNEFLERKGGKMGGKRTWQYVVKLNEVGLVNLGKVTLPYWDPDRSQYALASVELGQVHVKPSTVPEPPPASSADARAGDLPLVPRDKLAEVPPPPKYWADVAHFWQWLLLGPLGVIVGYALRSLASSIGSNIARKRDSVKRRTLTQLAACRQLLNDGDAPGAASALEKALVMAIEAATGLRARGIIREGLALSLEVAGLDRAQSESIVAILNVCDAIRFTGGEPSLLSDAIQQSQPMIEDLCRRATPKKGPAT